MKKLSVLLWSSVASGAAFSLANVVFRADVSALAFPVSLLFSAVLAYFSLVRLLRRNDARKIPVCRKLCQYLPFVLLVAFVFRRAGGAGTAHWFDWLSVLLWLAASVLSVLAQYFLAQKRLAAINAEWAESDLQASRKKPSGMARVAREAFEWIDAFVQAAFTVALLNIFIIQLYEIPSESMVPEFLVRDRVVVFKTASGPRFPLSDVGLPALRSYDRGDIVVFRNPHYSKDRKSEVRSFVSQLVYTLTFTMVNLNVDEQGNLKADPLVKRVCGLPGEQLMMQDGVLYARTSDSADFMPVAQDALWAEWDVASLPKATLDKVQDVPVPEDVHRSMLLCESERNALDYSASRAEAEELSRRFSDLRRTLYGADTATSVPELLSSADLFEYFLFTGNEDIARRLLSLDGGTLWFEDFMTGWIDSVPAEAFSGGSVLVGGDLYSDSNFRLNLMIKLTFGRLVVRNAELTARNVPVSSWRQDSLRREYMAQAEMLHAYTLLLDRRNMPVFPAASEDGSPRYIPEDSYFMMGDNRFNSLDMRHSYDSRLAPLTGHDKYSAYYYSNMEPQAVPARDILGTTVLRFWPWSRRGIPGLTGRQ